MPVREAQPFRSKKKVIEHVRKYSGKCGSLGRAFKKYARGQ